jgi:hypothetical protein
MKAENSPKDGNGNAEGGENYVHCAMLGDGMVGKTCLTLSYTQKLFTDNYTATVFDNYSGMSFDTLIVSNFLLLLESHFFTVHCVFYIVINE